MKAEEHKMQCPTLRAVLVTCILKLATFSQAVQSLRLSASHRFHCGTFGKLILRIIKTMLEDKYVCVCRLREGYEFFKSMAQRRSDLVAARASAQSTN